MHCINTLFAYRIRYLSASENAMYFFSFNSSLNYIYEVLPHASKQNNTNITYFFSYHASKQSDTNLT